EKIAIESVHHSPVHHLIVQHILQFYGKIIFERRQRDALRADQFERFRDRQMRDQDPAYAYSVVRHVVADGWPGEETGAHVGRGSGKLFSKWSRAMCSAHSRARLLVHSRRLFIMPN